MKKIAFVVLLSLSTIVACTRKENSDPNFKTVNLPLSDDVKTLDPANAYDTVSLTVMPLSLESLFQYAYLKTPLVLEPLLAESMPDVSKDKKVFTIKIKKGVMWQDDAAFSGGKGRELKAADFIYGWKRLALPQLQSNGTWIFEDKVVGYTEFKKKLFEDKKTPVEELMAAPLEGFKLVDDYTIQIKLIKPYPQLLNVLAMGFGAPVAKEVTDKYGHEGLNERMVGTGPFRLKQFVRNSKIILEKNLSFRGEKYPSEGDADAKTRGYLAAAGQNLPFVQEMNFHVFKESQPQWLQFMRGSLDFSGIPKDNFDTALENGVLKPELAKKGISFDKREEAVIFYLAFNMKDKLVGNNAYLRKAMAQAIDREYIIKTFRNGRAIKAVSIVPSAIAGHTGRSDLAGDFNLVEAKKNLVKAGFPEGKGLPEIRFDTRGASTDTRQLAEYISKALGEIGVKIKVEVNTFPGYLEKEKKGNLQFFIGGWSADYPDAENFLQLLYSKNGAPGPNSTNYNNPEFDRLYERIAAMMPSKERAELIKKAEQIAMDKDMTWSGLFYTIRYDLNHAWFKNYRKNELILNDLKYIDVDNELKRTTQKEKF